MKKPPFNTTTSKTSTPSYKFGDKELIGYASKKYFELFVNAGHSDKIYSVQTSDFPKDIPAVIYLPKRNDNIDWGRDGHGAEHIFVRLTPELIDFLAKRGVESAGYNHVYDDPYRVSNIKEYILNHAWVIKSAFHWVDPNAPLEDEDDIIVDPYYPHPEDNPENEIEQEKIKELEAVKRKTLLAALVAVITLFRQ